MGVFTRLTVLLYLRQSRFRGFDYDFGNYFSSTSSFLFLIKDKRKNAIQDFSY